MHDLIRSDKEIWSCYTIKQEKMRRSATRHLPENHWEGQKNEEPFLLKQWALLYLLWKRTNVWSSFCLNVYLNWNGL